MPRLAARAARRPGRNRLYRVESEASGDRSASACAHRWGPLRSEWALLGPCPIQQPVRQLRCSLELAEAPRAGRSRAVCLRAVELVALTGIPRLRLQCDQAGV